MILRVGSLLFVLSSQALAQSDARAEVRAALEEQVPMPSRPLVLPQPAVSSTPPAKPVETRKRAAESAQRRAEEATQRGRGLSQGHLPGDPKDAHGNLEQAGKSATGQARAEEVRKNSRGGKPPRPPKP